MIFEIYLKPNQNNILGIITIRKDRKLYAQTHKMNLIQTLQLKFEGSDDSCASLT